ncbi:unnamed protein product [Mytilus edulis]|uniref:Uncharacterized protein n=1 Tax=Mytilus edulis TaxID=6550 RepID=A0A8S3R4R9_MYTED|nr:unnamed protein product [Mytilus edulis]
MAEDVILLSMVYIINMEEGMSYQLEPFLLKEFAFLENSERYPRNIYEAIHGIQTSSGIADICVCVNNLLKQKGDSLIKCAWDNQKKHISKEQIESVKENLQSKVSIGNDEFLDSDDLLFAVVSVNEAGCYVCGCSFEGFSNDEEEDGAGITTNHEHDHASRCLPQRRNISPVATSAKSQSSIPNEQHSARYLSQRSVSLESKDNRDFVRSLSSTSDDQARLTMQAFEEHISSLSHKTKMKEVQIFYEDYKKYIKPGLEKVGQFIAKYELSSGDISERYGEDEIRISKLLTCFEDCNTDLAVMIKSKQWKTTKNVEKKLHQLVQLKSKLRDSVKELSSVKLKTDIAEPHNDIVEIEYKPQNKMKKRRNKGRGKNNWRKIDVNVVD